MEFDIIIKEGVVVDGTGNPGFIKDVGIQGTSIKKLGTNLGNAKFILDASNLVISPGFIDMHSHSDMTLPFVPRQDSMIRQGITTAVTGNCGFSLANIIRIA